MADGSASSAAATSSSSSSSSSSSASYSVSSGASRPDRPRDCEPDGKPMLRIDTHTHILPEEIPDFKSKYGYGGFVRLDHHEKGKARMVKDDGTFFREVHENCWSCARRLQECDHVGVDVHVLSTVPVMFSYWAKPEDCLDLSMQLNNHMAECVASNPRRFVGLGTVPMQDPDLACMELRRCVTELGLRGVQIGTHINDWTLAEPSLFKFFRTAEELGASVFIHPWDMVGSRLMSKYWLPWLVGMPAESSLAMCSLMFGGVLERLPDLRVLIAHGGGSLAATIGRIQHGFDVRPDLCAVDSKTRPMDYMGRFWADSLVHDKPALDFIVNTFTEDKVCLGSDYPFPLGEFTKESLGEEYAAGELIDSMTHWTPERKRKILGTNALDWLGLDVAHFHR